MKWLLVCLLLCVPSIAAAQSEPVVSYDLGVFANGVDPATGGQPVIPIANFTVSQVICGITKVTVTTPQQNPDEVRLDDPANAAALDCVIPNLAGYFAAVPLGTGYRTALRAHGATTVAPWSVLSNPFDRVATGVVLPATGVRVRKHP